MAGRRDDAASPVKITSDITRGLSSAKKSPTVVTRIALPVGAEMIPVSDII